MGWRELFEALSHCLEMTLKGIDPFFLSLAKLMKESIVKYQVLAIRFATVIEYMVPCDAGSPCVEVGAWFELRDLAT